MCSPHFFTYRLLAYKTTPTIVLVLVTRHGSSRKVMTKRLNLTASPDGALPHMAFIFLFQTTLLR
jgi:hypothetical protein